MIKIALVDDEINDLLKVIENLVSFDPHSKKIEVFPVLLSTDSEASVEKQSAWSQQNLSSVLATRNIFGFKFPTIKLLGPLDTTKQNGYTPILDLFAQEKVDVIISDSSMKEEMAGIVLLETSMSDPRWADNKWQCWLMTKWERIAKIIRDWRWSGKFDPYARYIDKKAIMNTSGSGICNPDLERVIEVAIKQNEASIEVRGRTTLGRLVGISSSMNGKGGVYEMIEASARNPASTVLITGESGTGKELVAREIHDRSGKPLNKFIDVNCAAIPKELIESELFGHEKGAFTGATQKQQGRFELAVGGTLFLDEIGDMPLTLQVKLLRVLEERRFRRLGARSEIMFDDMRIIAATNSNLTAMVASGKFRNDLYYRLNVFPIHIQPLCERREDIPLLVKHFIELFNRQTGRRVIIAEQAIEVLQPYHWPGNARQLRNCIERVFMLTQSSHISAEDIVASLYSEGNRLPSSAPKSSAFVESLISLDECKNKEPSEILEMIKEGKLVERLPEFKRLGEWKFKQLLQLIQVWTYTTYKRKYLDDDLARKMFNMNAEEYRQRMYQYEKKYDLIVGVIG